MKPQDGAVQGCPGPNVEDGKSSPIRRDWVEYPPISPNRAPLAPAPVSKMANLRQSATNGPNIRPLAHNNRIHFSTITAYRVLSLSKTTNIRPFGMVNVFSRLFSRSPDVFNWINVIPVYVRCTLYFFIVLDNNSFRPPSEVTWTFPDMITTCSCFIRIILAHLNQTNKFLLF